MTANPPFTAGKHTSHGRLDARATSPTGDEFIVEVKLLRKCQPEKTGTQEAETPEAGTRKERPLTKKAPKIKREPLNPPPPRLDDAESITRLREKTAHLAEAALSQVALKRGSKFEQGSDRLGPVKK